MKTNKPRKLFYDIENTPIVVTTWGLWEQNAIEKLEEWYMLSYAYKWEGEKEVHVVALPDFKIYKKDKKNDKELCESLIKLMNEADIVVAHNGNSHDQKKSNARFIYHGLTPPSPYKQIDTKLVAKKYFHFDSNSLDNLGTFFKLGNKIENSGIKLWRACMNGDMKAWTIMKKYNKQDVVLLEKVYNKMLPWMTDHPHMGLLIDGNLKKCRNCGSNKIQKRGFGINSKTRYQRIQCTDCGAWDKGENIKNEK